MNNNYNGYNNWQNPNGFVPQPEPREKGKKGAIIAVICVCLSLVLASAILGYSILNKDSSKEESTTKVEQKQETGEQASQTGSLSFSEVPDSTTTSGVPSASDVYKKVYESSVGISVYQKNSGKLVSEGSGVVMGLNDAGTSTYIITCAHVIEGSGVEYVVETADGNKYDAYMVGMDAKTDIGVIRVDNKNLKAAEFADSDTLEIGDTVYAIGNPGGSEFFGSFTNGMVSSIDRPVDSPVGYEVPCIQHTAPINPGNSGGALVNEFGQVVGINSSKIAHEDFEGMGFSVPSTMVKQIVDEIIKNGYVSSRAKLGISYSQASKDGSYLNIIKANNLPQGAVIIESIASDSELKNTNVKVGDMIIAVNGKNLDTYDILLDTIQNGKVGDTVTLTIARVGSDKKVTTFEVKVKLVEDK